MCIDVCVSSLTFTHHEHLSTSANSHLFTEVANWCGWLKLPLLLYLFIYLPLLEARSKHLLELGTSAKGGGRGGGLALCEAGDVSECR